MLFEYERFMKITLPIALTLSRIAVTPIILALLIPNRLSLNILAALLFMAASITDYFDGYYARKLNLVSNLGKFLDPIADKILVSALLIYLVSKGTIDPWMVILFVTRDTLVGGIRSIAAAENLIIDAKATGKWKAALQMIALPLVMLGPIPWDVHNRISLEVLDRVNAFGGPQVNAENLLLFPNQFLGWSLLWLSVILSLKSGYDYFMGYIDSKKGQL